MTKKELDNIAVVGMEGAFVAIEKYTPYKELTETEEKYITYKLAHDFIEYFESGRITLS